MNLAIISGAFFFGLNRYWIRKFKKRINLEQQVTENYKLVFSFTV